MNDDAAVASLFAGDSCVFPQTPVPVEAQPELEQQRSARRCKVQSTMGIAPVVCGRQVKVRASLRLR